MGGRAVWSGARRGGRHYLHGFAGIGA